MSYFGKVQLKDQYGFVLENTPMGEIRSARVFRLVGAIFSGSTIDPSFWTVTSASATATLSGGEIILASGTSGSASVTLQSKRYARYIGGNSNRYRAQIQFRDTGVTNNTKKWGMFNGSDGTYFKLSDTTLYACTLKSGSEIAITSGSWNGSTTVPTLTNCNAYEIYITNKTVYFVINDVLMHTASFPTTTWTSTMNLPIKASNVNTGNTTNTNMNIRVNTIYRLGELETLPTYMHISASGSNVCKYGAGSLHNINVNNPTNNNITIYDNTIASGSVIAIINPGNGTLPFMLMYNVPFSLGLTVVTDGTPDLTVIYE